MTQVKHVVLDVLKLHQPRMLGTGLPCGEVTPAIAKFLRTRPRCGPSTPCAVNEPDWAGGATVDELEGRAEEKPFDWKEEIEDVVRPLLEELKRMTERPRTIERLRSEKALYTDRLELADRAIRRLSGVIEATDSPAVREVLQELLKDWQSHRADADSRLQLAQTQLQHLLAPEEESGGGLTDALREFFSGRGLNMALALAAFGLSYAALLGLARLLAWLPKRRTPVQRGRFARAGTMLFRILVFLIALSAAMGVLSARGDWLILGPPSSRSCGRT